MPHDRNKNLVKVGDLVKVKEAEVSTIGIVTHINPQTESCNGQMAPFITTHNLGDGRSLSLPAMNTGTKYFTCKDCINLSEAERKDDADRQAKLFNQTAALTSPINPEEGA